jgi:RNA recognition motif-containing protein
MFVLGVSVYVANLSKKLTESDLEDKFSKYGNIVSCKLVKDPITRYAIKFKFNPSNLFQKLNSTFKLQK